MYVPDGAKAATGADGSVGGLGTRDAINSGPRVAGLVKKEKRIKTEDDMDGVVEDAPTDQAPPTPDVKEETEDEKALRAILASANPDDDGTNVPTIDAIPSGGNAWTRPADETDAYRQDVLTRPDEATLDDYDRVPVAEFGAALLRGMGWKPGTAASRTRTGPAEPWLPTARPALLGIGAKERVVADDGTPQNGKAKAKGRPERRYVPLVKRERERDGEERGSVTRSETPQRTSAPVSRRASRSPERRERDRDRVRDDRRGDYHNVRDDKRNGDREYESDRGGRRYRERESNRSYDRTRERR